MATTFKVEQDQLDMIAESLDLWPERVTAMQKWFAQNGPHCLDEKSTKLHVAQFLPNQSENPIQRRLFSNEEDFIDFIGHCVRLYRSLDSLTSANIAPLARCYRKPNFDVRVLPDID
jgi:hypothetical protein